MEETLLMLKSTFQAYAKVDKSRNTLTIAEMKELVVKEIFEGDTKMMESPKMEDFIKRFDKNQDNKVDLAEFLHFTGGLLRLLAKMAKKQAGDGSLPPPASSNEYNPGVMKSLLLLRETFEKYAEKDQAKKTLTKPELEQLLKKELSQMKHAAKSNHRMNALFKSMDKNKDNLVDFPEFLRFIGRMLWYFTRITGLEKSLCVLEGTFESYAVEDPNKETLTNAELKALMKNEFFVEETKDQSLMTMIDSNGDKKVDFPEFLKFSGMFLAVVAECKRKLPESSDPPTSSTECQGIEKALCLLQETFEKYAICDETHKTMNKGEMKTLLMRELHSRNRGVEANRNIDALIAELDENHNDKLDLSAFLKFCGVMFMIIGTCGTKVHINALEEAMFMIKDTFERYAKMDETKKTLTKCEMKTLLLKEWISEEGAETEEAEKVVTACTEGMDLNTDNKLDFSEFLVFVAGLLLNPIKSREHPEQSTSGLKQTLKLLRRTFKKYAKEDPTRKTLTNTEMKILLEKEFLGATQAEMGDPEVDALILKMDTNQDNKLDFTEFMQFASSLFLIVSVCGRKLQACEEQEKAAAQ
ncbi:uncharacterized protein LOC114472134 [Gouania willdenowi]|uniref:uncharacterized protein LOC114472134 n=1 Tax=Gouania willdenowi TaxID=441366 RepID=UPI0010542C07|nr:uncharacterized protein LOC114472134 [Gouania willdenowi]XP_028317054.1 uncharacterized protein LOC114472134 [Gouania willdenowi]